MDESHTESSGARWRRVQADEGTVWVDTEFTAHVDTIELGYARHFVYVTGTRIPSYAVMLEAARIILPPNTYVALLPGRVFGGPSQSRVAMETSDQALAEVWAAAAKAEDAL